MRRTIKRAVTASAACAAVTAGLAATAPAASADCVTYTQHPIVEADIDSDGNKDATAWYPPVVTDVTPRDCLNLNQSETPKVVTFP